MLFPCLEVQIFLGFLLFVSANPGIHFSVLSWIQKIYHILGEQIFEYETKVVWSRPLCCSLLVSLPSHVVGRPLSLGCFPYFSLWFSRGYGLGSQVLCTSMKGVRAVCLPSHRWSPDRGGLLHFSVKFILPSHTALLVFIFVFSVEASCLCACFTDPGRDAQHFPSSVFSVCSFMLHDVSQGGHTSRREGWERKSYLVSEPHILSGLMTSHSLTCLWSDDQNQVRQYHPASLS